VILIDSNIPMYLVGAAHPLKAESQLILERLISSRQRLVTDAEVFQEILHRYAAIGRREAIGAAFQVLLDVVDEVLPVTKREVLRAGEIAQLPASFSARDALHLAVMELHRIDSIFTFDADFDRWPGLKRIAS
jgi:uncharacterized protein